MSRTPRSRRLELAALVAIGGFLGATSRYLVGVAVSGLAGTLAVNAGGSFLLATLLYAATGSDRFTRELRAVLSTGFLASFTTYSTFAVESATATPLLAAGNVAATYGLGIAGVRAGRALARQLGGGDPAPTPEGVA